uniref:CCR4-NOT transcription complex subunit 2 n=1 Tax=Ciona savignyi TaxID=51511 RepID=H2ZK46_CIOSA
MVNDRNQVSAQEVDIMFNSNVGTPKKNKLPFGNSDENDFDMSTYLSQNSGGVAEMLGQSQYPSFYGQQRSLIEGGSTSGVGTRPTVGQQTFGRSLSIPGHITPTSSENQSQVNQSRGILPMNRNSLANMTGIGSNSIPNRMPSPTRGISPIDLFSMKPPGNRPLNTAAISRNHSFSTQSMPISAIGSESLSQFRQQQQQNNLSQGGLSSSGPMGIPGLNPFNLDQSEFPALAQRTRPIGSQPSSSNSTKSPYVHLYDKLNQWFSIFLTS